MRLYKQTMNLRKQYLVDTRHHQVDTRMLEDTLLPVHFVQQTRSTHERQQLHMRMYKQTMNLRKQYLVDTHHHLERKRGL